MVIEAKGKNLTLSLWEERVLHQTKFLPQHLEHPLSQGLAQNVCCLQIWRNMLKNHCFFLNFVPIETVLDIYVTWSNCRNLILREFDTTLIVTVYHSGLQHLIGQLCYQLGKSCGFKSWLPYTLPLLNSMQLLPTSYWTRISYLTPSWNKSWSALPSSAQSESTKPCNINSPSPTYLKT